MQKEKFTSVDDNLLTDILLPAFVTFMILFCLIQISMSITQPSYPGQLPLVDNTGAISTFRF